MKPKRPTKAHVEETPAWLSPEDKARLVEKMAAKLSSMTAMVDQLRAGDEINASEPTTQ